jgi:hypothetical protein
MQARGADHGAVRDGTASRRPIFHVLVAGAAAALIVAGLSLTDLGFARPWWGQLQGYLLSRPMDAIRATSLIAGGATVPSVTARAS